MVKFLSIVIAISFALAVGAESQPPAPAPAEKSKAPQGKSTKDQKRAATDQRGTDSSPLVVKVIPTKEAQPPAEGKPYKHYHESAADWWLIIPTWILAFVTGGLLIYNAVLASITKKSVAVVQDTAKRQLRAYVTVDVNSPHFNPGLRVRIKNHGVTPASNVSIWTNVVEDIPPDGFAHPDIHAPVLGGYLVAPQQHCTINTVPQKTKEDPSFFVYGHIDYTDIFKDRWTVHYCHRYRGNSEFFPHPHHNKESYVGKDPVA